MLKRTLGCTFFVSFALCSGQALANDASIPDAPSPVPGEQDVGEAISPMKKGQFAPFTGVLLAPKAIAKIVAELASFGDKVKIETDKVRGEEQAKAEFKLNEQRIVMETQLKVAQAKLDSNLVQIKVLEDRLKKEEGKPSALTWGFVGLGTGIGAAVLTTIVVSVISAAGK